MNEPKKVPKDEELKSLSDRLARIQESKLEAVSDTAPNSGMALGMRMASEFASAILVGGLFGYGIDYWLKSLPIGLIVGIGFGFAAGTMNIIRVAKSYNENGPKGVDLPPTDDEEDE